MTECWHSNNDEGLTPGPGRSPVRTASEMLKAAREKKGLSQKDVADKMFLTTAFVRYIDEGAFDKIPKPAFIKGYLRSYARVVGLSGDEVVGAYQRGVDEAEQAFELRDVTDESVGSHTITGPVVQTGVGGLAGLVMIVGLVWWLVGGDEESPRQPASDAMAEAETVGPVSAEPGIGRSNRGQASTATGGETESSGEIPVVSGGEADSGDEGTAPVADLDEQPADSGPGAQAQEPGAGVIVSAEQEVTVERISRGEANYITVNAGGEAKIEFSFSDECWVEVTDGNDASIYSDLNRQGDVLTIHGVAPFEVLLGRATSVTLRYNDEPVDFERRITSEKTARLTLGGSSRI